MTGVEVEHGGETETFEGDIVVVSCGAANSAKLLLASANDAHPHGLANGSDQVGRNYMFHNSQAVLALSKEENPTIFQKTLGVNDFYFSGGEDFEFPLGNIQMVGKSQAPMFRGEKPGETRFAPNWTLEEVARHAVDFWLSTEDLPSPENRVTLARDGNIVIDYTAEQRRGQGSPVRKAQGHARRISACTTGTCCRITPTSRTRSRSPAAPTRPARAGSAPTRDSSVLNPDCRAHEVDNLYVVDTSFFPSIGAVNPALTAMANAHPGRRPPARTPRRHQPQPEPAHA